MEPFAYHRPRTVAEACALARELPEARFIAGGTDLWIRLRRAELDPPALISLRHVAELSAIEPGPVTRIGALTTITDLRQHPLLQERYPALVQAAGFLGSEQIRNVATVGGNLCNASPCADTATPLLVYDARVEIQGSGGRRELPLESFFAGPGTTCLAPGELLAAVLLDTPAAGTRATFRKQGRVRLDLALASVAVLLELEGERCRKARLAAGSSAPTPVRLMPAEERLTGQQLTREVVAEAAAAAGEAVEPISDLRASADYRRQLVAVFVRRGVEQLLGWRHDS